MAFQNTVAILANGVAVRNLTKQIAEVGSRPGDKGRGVARVVFEDKLDLLKHMNAERRANGITLTKSDLHVYDLSTSESRSGAVRDDIRRPGNWVKVPNTPTYGDLAGKIVHGPVWARIQDAVNRKPVVDFPPYNALMRMFKSVKTKYSPGTIAANVMNNITMAHLNDLDPTTVATAMKTYLKYKTMPEKMTDNEMRMMSEFHRSGGTLGDWSTTEIKQAMYEAMVRQSEVGQGYENGEHGSIGRQIKHWSGYNGEIAQKAIGIAKRSGRKVSDVMSDVYATGDNMFRLASFMDKMSELQKTMPDVLYEQRLKIAGNHAKKSFLDYDTDSRFAQIAKQTALPFVSWAYAYTGLVAKTAIHAPWKIASMALAYQMVTSALSAAFGEPDEKERTAAGMSDKTWFGANKQIGLGKDSEGRQRYFNAARWFLPSPIEFTDQPSGFMGIKSWPAVITPNNPVASILFAMKGYDPYTGQSMHKDSNTPMQNLIASSKAAYNVVTPPAAGFDGKGNLKAMGAEPGLMGKTEPDSMYYSRMFMGMPWKSLDPQEAQLGVQLQIQRTERAFTAEMRSNERMAEAKKWSQEKRQEARAALMSNMQERIAELQKGLK